MNSEKMKIKILIDEVVVEGQITYRTAGGISVKITNPFENLSTGLHIPAPARAVMSYEGERGDATAESLLKELYEIGRYIDTNLVKLRENLDLAKNSVRNIPDKFDKEDFYTKRRELRQLLKQKKLDNVTHQNELALLRKKHDEYDSKVRVIMDEFFKYNFPIGKPYGTREEVLDIIEGNKNLTKNSTER